MGGGTGGWALAVDVISGTFADLVLPRRDGHAATDQTLTTHRDRLEGFFRAVDLALGRAGIAPAQVGDVTVHATTLVTNAVIERCGPPSALLATEGFADLLIIRDEHRHDMFDPQIAFPAPLVPEDLTFTLRGGTLAEGTVLRAADPAATAARRSPPAGPPRRRSGRARCRRWGRGIRKSPRSRA
jgi:N-methylhydantoinase A